MAYQNDNQPMPSSEREEWIKRAMDAGLTARDVPATFNAGPSPYGTPMYSQERAQWQQRALDAGFTPQELPATFAPSPAFPQMTVNPMSEYRIPEQPVYLPRETPKLTFDQPMTMGYWVSPQTGIPYNRNDFDGSLVRWGNQSGVPSSQRDLDAHRAQWAQQDASGAAGGMVPIGGNISALADARQRLINAHGMVPLQMSGQQPQLAMGMAEQIYGGGALGNHPIQHTDYWNNRYTQRQAQAADRLGIAQNVAMLPLERRQRMENAMMQSQQAIGGSWAGHTIPVEGVATMTDKQAEGFFANGAEAESQRTGIPVDTIIAWRRLGFLNEKARIMRSQPKPQALQVQKTTNPDLSESLIGVDLNNRTTFPLTPQGGTSAPQFHAESGTTNRTIRFSDLPK